MQETQYFAGMPRANATISDLKPLQSATTGSVDLLGFALHVIHQQILAEGVRRGEVGLAAAHFRDFLDEVDEAVIAGEHKGIDHDAGALALVDFFERLADYEWIQTEGVFVNAAVFER